MTEKELRYSVIVPAYNAVGTLRACLEALLAQSVPRSAYEVLVIDDGSTDGTAELATQSPVRVLRQAHAGPASARNLGARTASGKFLLFTDADCLPIKTWIAEISRPLEADCHIAGVKGVYRTRQNGLIARLAQLEFEEKYSSLRRSAFIDFVDTGSAAFRADAFWQAGGFDAAFRAASNEDTLLSFSLVARGWRLVFAERAAVYHHHSDHLGRYLRRKWRHGYWRTRVYRQFPAKILGDSYTPRSTQLQLLSVAATIGLAAPRRFRGLVPFALLLFALSCGPFIRRALPGGARLSAAVPFVLFLRALALEAGLVQGALVQWIEGFRSVSGRAGKPPESTRPRLH